jgi:acetyl esterase
MMVDISKLNPDIKKFLDVLNSIPAPADPTVEEGRAAYLQFALANAGWPLTMARVEDLMIQSSDAQHQIPIRIYTPILDKKLPALVYYHGGGWQRGDIATHDSICRHLAKFSGCIVVSAQWRLAPENKFPTGLNDCFMAYEWVTHHADKYNIDTTRLAIGGDSAGGNMTAATIQRLRKTKLQKPIFQLLMYASLDLSCSTQTYTDFAEGFFLSTARVKYYVKGYINGPEDIKNPLVSPLLQEDLSDIPRTHLVTAGFDPLRGEGELYYKRLKDAGTNVSYKCYEGMIHAFLHMNHSVPAVETALQEIAGVLKEALNA